MSRPQPQRQPRRRLQTLERVAASDPRTPGRIGDVLDPFVPWERFGGRQLGSPDINKAAQLATEKLNRLYGADAALQNYAYIHDRALRVARAQTELRMGELLRRIMGDQPFARRPPAWRGTTAQTLLLCMVATINAFPVLPSLRLNCTVAA